MYRGICLFIVTWAMGLSQGTPGWGQGEAPSAEGPGPAAQSFAAVMDEWKTLLDELRDIQAEYKVAEESELDALRGRWEEKLAEGNALAPRLRAAAVAAYQEAPNVDRQLSRFLIKLIADDIRQDNYASALELAQMLIDRENDERELHNLVGIAAFGSNDFATAETHLREAERAGTLAEQGENFLSGLEECKKAWEEESRLRAAEAQVDDLPRVKLQTTAGDIVLELFENEAPETVANFISLVENGFYDGLTFHRVLPGFMAQGGCPNGDGTGGPGYNIYCECINDNHRKHFAGSLSMAKERAPHTGGSQFFINFVPTPHLNGKHTVFGRVVEGMEVLPKIRRVDPAHLSDATETTSIVKAEVLRKRDHEYRPNKVK